VILLFTVELKYTRMYNTTDVTPFHGHCFHCYNDMTSLRVTQGRRASDTEGGWDCRLNSCAQPTRGGPTVLGLGREKIIPDDTKYANLNDEIYSSKVTISVGK
jgi:hypothetical protein